jgi:hypothetical protein
MRTSRSIWPCAVVAHSSGCVTVSTPPPSPGLRSEDSLEMPLYWIRDWYDYNFKASQWIVDQQQATVVGLKFRRCLQIKFTTQLDQSLVLLSRHASIKKAVEKMRTSFSYLPAVFDEQRPCLVVAVLLYRVMWISRCPQLAPNTAMDLASELLSRLHKECSQVHGVKHPLTKTCHYLHRLLNSDRDLRGAVNLAKLCYEAMERHAGRNVCTTLMLHWYWEVEKIANGEQLEAEEERLRCLVRTSLATTGLGSRPTLPTRMNLARNYFKQGRNEEAIEQLNAVVYSKYATPGMIYWCARHGSLAREDDSTMGCTGTETAQRWGEDRLGIGRSQELAEDPGASELEEVMGIDPRL